MGGHRIAIGPFSIGADIKRISFTIVGDFPSFRLPRERLQRLRIMPHQALDKRAQNRALRAPGDRLRVEVGRFSSVGHV